MNLIKKIWEKLSHPKLWFLILFYIFFVCIVALTLTLVIISKEQSFLHYILYVISAIALTYFVYTIILFAPKIKSSIIHLLQKHKFTNEILNNYGYRTIIFSVISFILNMSYVIFQGVLAFITLSPWYISITVYYLLLSLVKGNVFLAKKRNPDCEENQAKTYKTSGILFIFLTVAFSGVIVLIYTSNMYFEYAGLMIYAVAAFTFYKLTLAIINIFKAKKHNDMFIQNIRNINLVSALVSIIVLQVAMFQAFSPEHNTSIANGLTGAGVSLLILALGIYMIIKANKILKNKKETKDGE